MSGFRNQENSNDVTLNASSVAIGKLAANSGVDIGDVTINNASGGSAVNIQDGGNTITVDGTITANLSATDNTVLDNIDSNTDYGAVVGGGVEATALRVTLANDSTGVVSVDDSGGALTMDTDPQKYEHVFEMDGTATASDNDPGIQGWVHFVGISVPTFTGAATTCRLKIIHTSNGVDFPIFDTTAKAENGIYPFIIDRYVTSDMDIDIILDAAGSGANDDIEVLILYEP